MKPPEACLPLLFEGRRWPRAVTFEEVREVLASPTFGTAGQPSHFVRITVSGGIGRAWQPEANDASWRTLADIDLSDSTACLRFVLWRGDPTGLFQPGEGITSAAWWTLVEALRQAALAWQPPDADGISHPTTNRVAQEQAVGFLQDSVCREALKRIDTVLNPTGVGLALRCQDLAAFLIVRAATALQRPRPMRACDFCEFWFEVSQLRQRPRFCSASCRALDHQRETFHSIRSQGPPRGENHALTSQMEAEGWKRTDQATYEELFDGAGSARVRGDDSARG